ncbi:MAG: peptide-modifying radical SAM enzyme CbpB [Nitrospirota bacterium]
MERKGLSYFNIDKLENNGLASDSQSQKNQVLLDADNVFWGITKSNNNSDALISRELLSLYERVKGKCDREMEDFRFSTELTAIYIDPTDLCNADCPYCYVPVKTRKYGRSMTQEELDSILQKIAKYFAGRPKKAVIIFHASEPLLVKDIIFKAIERFKNNFYFGIQTNGLLLEDKEIKFIKDNNVGIGISLDASNAVLNNRLRFSATHGGNFKKVIRAIDSFNGYEGLNVITTITKLNVRNLPVLVRLLHKKKVPCVLINPVRLTQKNARFLKPDDKVMAKYFIEAVEEAVRYSKTSKHKIIIGNFANIILGIIAPTARRLMCDISPCGGGRCFLTITACGDMIPCGEFIGLREFRGGNIFKDSIDQAMASEPFKKMRSRIVEDIAECDLCTFRNICGAPCPAELHAFGNMHKKAVFCEFYKEIINYAFKLIAEGKEKYLLRKEGFANLNYQYKLESDGLPSNRQSHKIG